MAAWIAAAAALLFAAAAYARSRKHGANYYESEEYGMTPRAHRGFALAGLLLAVVLVCSRAFAFLLWPAVGVLVLAGIFYFASFARGFSDVE